jgi:hypothetical protein
MAKTAVLRVRVKELRRLVAISGELSDVLLSAFDAPVIRPGWCGAASGGRW